MGVHGNCEARTTEEGWSSKGPEGGVLGEGMLATRSEQQSIKLPQWAPGRSPGDPVIMVAPGDLVIMVALCNRADHYIFILFLLLYGRRM